MEIYIFIDTSEEMEGKAMRAVATVLSLSQASTKSSISSFSNKEKIHL